MFQCQDQLREYKKLSEVCSLYKLNSSLQDACPSTSEVVEDVNVSHRRRTLRGGGEEGMSPAPKILPLLAVCKVGRLRATHSKFKEDLKHQALCSAVVPELP